MTIGQAPQNSRGDVPSGDAEGFIYRDPALVLRVLTKMAEA